jgi:hypothetical protein
MNAHVLNRPCWSTSTFPASGESLATELTMLRRHLDRCHDERGRWFGLRCAIDAVHAFVAPRLVTTLVAATAALGLASGALI